MTRVVVLDDYQQVAHRFADWGSLGPDVEMEALPAHFDDLDELADRLASADVVVAMRERTPITAALLDRLPNLRLIVTTGPRNAVIDVAATAARGVTVCGTGGRVSPTSELTWGLILALLRHIPEEDAAVRAGNWQQTIGSELDGKTLGLLGLGNLGKLVARVAPAFGMETIAWSQHLTGERAAEVGVQRVERDELFARADVLSIHLVLSDRTRGLVGRAELAAMKPTAVLINTSRGPIVDEQALVDALRNGTIAGAGLDVFDREPLAPDDVLRTLPNTVLTPHIGYVTDRLYARFYREIVEDIAAWLAGEPIRVVQPPEEA